MQRDRRFVFDSDALEKLTGCAWFSSRKIESTLGFKPIYDLEKAMPEMVAEHARQRSVVGGQKSVVSSRRAEGRGQKAVFQMPLVSHGLS